MPAWRWSQWGIATAEGPLTLGVGVLAAGMSYGVAISAPLALIVGAQWRWVWGVFAVIAVVTTAWAAATLPRGQLGSGVQLPRLRFSWFIGPRSGPLLATSFFVGLGAAPYWTFAVDHVIGQEILSASGGRLLYAAIGIAGLTGAIAGDLVKRYPLRWVYATLAVDLAAAFVLLAQSTAATSVVVSGLLLGLLVGPALAGQAATYVDTQVVFLVAAVIIAATAALPWRTTLAVEGSPPRPRHTAHAR